MNNFELLERIANEFGEIAKKVNEASTRRKLTAESTVKDVAMLIDIENIIEKEMHKVANANQAQRDFGYNTLAGCEILKYNVEAQKNMINYHKEKQIIPIELLNTLMEKANKLENALNEAIENLHTILSNDNRIIFRDSYLIKRKESQLLSLKALSDMTTNIVKDALNAESGSASNLQRGLKLVDRLKGVASREIQNKENIESLIKDVRTGGDIARQVNNNSRSQLEFSEKIKQFTQQLMADSIEIKEIVKEKHALFEDNLQIITVLIVIITMKFKEYLSVQDYLNKIEAFTSNLSGLHSLITYIQLAIATVANLTSQNYDITDSIHKNNEIETKTVSMTDTELNYYNKINSDVEQMTEVTGYPITGSAQNIKNSEILEVELKKVLSN